MISGALGRRLLSLALLAVFGVVALALGLATPLAFALVAVALIGAALLPHITGAAAVFGHGGLILFCLALGAHLIPGFHNLLVLDHVQAGPESTAFTMYLNLDKPMVMFAVLLARPGMIHGTAPIRGTALLVAVVTLPVLFILAMSAGAVRPEVSLPPWWMIFAISNLFLTCLTEEAFFRGYLQSFITSKLGPAIGIAVAGTLFGLAHFGGGLALVIFASILGAACGLGYYATGRLWVPVLMHFGFNALHLFLFTYPTSA